MRINCDKEIDLDESKIFWDADEFAEFLHDKQNEILRAETENGAIGGQMNGFSFYYAYDYVGGDEENHRGILILKYSREETPKEEADRKIREEQWKIRMARELAEKTARDEINQARAKEDRFNTYQKLKAEFE